MNAITANLIDRPYQEVVDDILTALVGGVVNEPIPFDVKSNVYALSSPAQGIRSITGTFEDPKTSQITHRSFQLKIDFVFDATKNAVIWQEGGNKPKDETTFFVNYFRPNSSSPISDTNVGGVARTLSEAIGREIATVYQQINLAYQSGFVDTAAGKSLDFVVSILGITRKTKDFAVGAVTFFRDLTEANPGNITIPQGASMATTDGTVTFQTTEPRTMQIGQARIDAPVRADDAFKGDKGIVPPGTITALSQRIDGIDHISNIDATARAAQDESDDDLRLRAKAVLQGLGKGTIAAIEQAVFNSRATVKAIRDPNIPGATSDPGTVIVQVETEAARFLEIQSAVNEVRAAGIETTVVGKFILMKPRVVARITPGLTGAGKDKIKNNIIAAIEKLVDALKAGSSLAGGDMKKAIQGVPDVLDATIVDVRTVSANVGDTVETVLENKIVDAVKGVNAADDKALRAAIQDALSAPPPPADFSSAASRQFVIGAKGPASDGEIELAAFQVKPDSDFSISLDMAPADIVLQES